MTNKNYKPIWDMTIVDQAHKFALLKHDGQKDDTGQDYIIHPVQVASILGQVTNDENMIAAALLHDTLEDTQTTYAELERYFGKDIADLVNEVTHETINGVSYFPRLRSQRAIMLKLADRLSNISRMETWDDAKKNHYMRKTKFWPETLAEGIEWKNK